MVEIESLSIRFGGIDAHFSVSREVAWELLKNVEKTAQNNVGALYMNEVANVDDDTCTPATTSSSPAKRAVRNDGHRTTAEAIRGIATEVCKDGDYHPRRDISAAVREADISTANLDEALKTEFEPHRVDGRPHYRIADPDHPGRRARTARVREELAATARESGPSEWDAMMAPGPNGSEADA